MVRDSREYDGHRYSKKKMILYPYRYSQLRYTLLFYNFADFDTLVTHF